MAGVDGGEEELVLGGQVIVVQVMLERLEMLMREVYLLDIIPVALTNWVLVGLDKPSMA